MSWRALSAAESPGGSTAPASTCFYNKRSAVSWPLSGASMCVKWTFLLTLSMAHFSGCDIVTFPCLFCIPYCAWRVSKGARADVCDCVRWVLCTYLMWGTGNHTGRIATEEREREKRQDENPDNTTLMHNCTLSNVKLKCAGIDLVLEDGFYSILINCGVIMCNWFNIKPFTPENRLFRFTAKALIL